jgi:hypothetical protein
MKANLTNRSKLYLAANKHLGAAGSGNAYTIQTKLTPRIRLPFGKTNPKSWYRRTCRSGTASPLCPLALSIRP